MKKGFTLLEILIAVMILTLGILAVAQMVVLGTRTSQVINRQMYARDLLNRQYEFLQGLPTSDTLYLKDRNPGSLDDTIVGICDYRFQQATKGGVFRVVWNVRDSIRDTIPDPRFKTIRLHVIGNNAKPWMKSDLIKRF